MEAHPQQSSSLNITQLEGYVYSKPDTVISIVNSLIASNSLNDSIKVELLLYKVRAQMATADYFSAERLLKTTITKLSSTDKLQTLLGGKVLSKYSRVLALLEQMDEAYSIFLQAKDIIILFGTTEDRAQLYMDEAEFNRMRNDHVQYEACLRKAWIEVAKCDKPVAYARYYNRYASLKTSKIELDSSLYFSQLAIKYARQIKDLNTVGWSLNEIAFVKENQAPRAPNTYFLQSAVVFLQTGNMQGYTHTLMNYTRYLIANKRYKEAFSVLDTCRKYIEHGDQYLNERTKLYGHYSHLFREINRYDSALVYYELHMNERFKQHDRLLSDKVAYHQARYDNAANKQAIEKQKLALELEHTRSAQRAKERNQIIFVAIVLLLVAIILAMLTTRLRRSNNQLKKVSDEVKDYNIQLVKSLEYEQILLREVHHRVKNNLQLIISLMELGSEGDHVNLLSDTVGRIRSIGMVHDMVHRHENIAELELQQYTLQLYNAVARSYSRNAKTIVDIKMEETKVGLEQAIPIGIIMNELFTNAWKYVYPNTKQMQIKLSIIRDNDILKLEYQDNGPGLPKNIDFNNSSGMGLFLIKNMALQLKGNLIYEYREGMRVEIKFDALLKGSL